MTRPALPQGYRWKFADGEWDVTCNADALDIADGAAVYSAEVGILLMLVRQRAGWIVWHVYGACPCDFRLGDVVSLDAVAKRLYDPEAGA